MAKILDLNVPMRGARCFSHHKAIVNSRESHKNRGALVSVCSYERKPTHPGHSAPQVAHGKSVAAMTGDLLLRTPAGWASI
jgi:hypothetical protein